MSMSLTCGLQLTTQPYTKFKLEYGACGPLHTHKARDEVAYVVLREGNGIRQRSKTAQFEKPVTRLVHQRREDYITCTMLCDTLGWGNLLSPEQPDKSVNGPRRTLR